MELRRLLKKTLDCAAIIIVVPAVLIYRTVSLLVGPGRAFPAWSQFFALIPGVTGIFLRRAFYRMVLMRCGEDAWIAFGTIFSGAKASVGRNTYIGCFCCLGEVTLGDDVLIGSHVSIMNGSRQHGISRLDLPVREQPGEWRDVAIGNDTWIGDRAVIMADVGSHAVIGAGSVVTRPLQDFTISVGNPARVIRHRTETGHPNSRQTIPQSEDANP